jgi:hypothetical protein
MRSLCHVPDTNQQIIFRQRPTGIPDGQTFAMQEVPVVPPMSFDLAMPGQPIQIDAIGTREHAVGYRDDLRGRSPTEKGIA